MAENQPPRRAPSLPASYPSLRCLVPPCDQDFYDEEALFRHRTQEHPNYAIVKVGDWIVVVQKRGERPLFSCPVTRCNNFFQTASWVSAHTFSEHVNYQPLNPLLDLKSGLSQRLGLAERPCFETALSHEGEAPPRRRLVRDDPPIDRWLYSQSVPPPQPVVSISSDDEPPLAVSATVRGKRVHQRSSSLNDILPFLEPTDELQRRFPQEEEECVAVDVKASAELVEENIESASPQELQRQEGKDQRHLDRHASSASRDNTGAHTDQSESDGRTVEQLLELTYSSLPRSSPLEDDEEDKFLAVEGPKSEFDNAPPGNQSFLLGDLYEEFGSYGERRASERSDDASLNSSMHPLLDPQSVNLEEENRLSTESVLVPTEVDSSVDFDLGSRGDKSGSVLQYASMFEIPSNDAPSEVLVPTQLNEPTNPTTPSEDEVFLPVWPASFHGRYDESVDPTLPLELCESGLTQANNADITKTQSPLERKSERRGDSSQSPFASDQETDHSFYERRAEVASHENERGLSLKRKERDADVNVDDHNTKRPRHIEVGNARGARSPSSSLSRRSQDAFDGNLSDMQDQGDEFGLQSSAGFSMEDDKQDDWNSTGSEDFIDKVNEFLD
ncbi:hypothetical protein SCHPADRAFT_947080 [Schizopora paradoxa]|uniref:C2H2-type domain-containing protein n=1 Tax=Schizopora paradoxa TaxID=27342 RepID=A0A0H2R0I3_9AGAM|nr:hypothetical protein SCHPADRAFT_947080 [Schizopora paradoxa]